MDGGTRKRMRHVTDRASAQWWIVRSSMVGVPLAGTLGWGGDRREVND